MKKIRILHLGLTGNPGGVEAYCLNLSAHINRDLFQMDFLKVGDGKLAHEYEFIKNGSKVNAISSKRRNPVKYFYELFQLFRKGNYDIVEFHIIDYIWSEPILFAKLFSNSRVILHAHTTKKLNSSIVDRFRSSVGEFLIRPKTLELVACGDEAGRVFFRGIKFKLLPNAIDVERMSFSPGIRKKVRDSLGFKAEDFVIGHVGAFWYPKNHPFIIDMFREIALRDDAPRLVLVGDGGGLGSILEKLEEYEIKNRVTHLGTRGDVPDLLQAFDILVLPSIYEGLPLILIEAQAAGLKCITSEGRVSPEVRVTDCLSFIPIEQGISPWVDAILKLKSSGYKRKNQEDSLTKSGYNIDNQIKFIEVFYSKESGRL